MSGTTATGAEATVRGFRIEPDRRLPMALRAMLAALLLSGCGDSKEGLSAQKDVFDENVVTTYSITMDPADWDAIVANPLDDTWRHMNLEWEGELWLDVA